MPQFFLQEPSIDSMEVCHAQNRFGKVLQKYDIQHNTFIMDDLHKTTDTKPLDESILRRSGTTFRQSRYRVGQGRYESGQSQA